MDIPSLLKLLNENKVKYVVIGAAAFPANGYTRATNDIDIYIEPTLENATRTHHALTQFGYDTTDLVPHDFLKNKVLIQGYIVECDTHPYVAGVKDFEQIWSTSIVAEILGVSAHFADLDNLILMKKAAGRPKDIEDLRYLEKLKSS